jgi:DNA polymerase I-like protein with 3'-5' exonuclease and polymerase domains
VAQIHDELIFEIEENLIDEVVPEIKKIMENVFQDFPLKEKKKLAPLLVEPKIGENWAELK